MQEAVHWIVLGRLSINRIAAPPFNPGSSTGISHKKGAAKVTRLTQATVRQ